MRMIIAALLIAAGSSPAWAQIKSYEITQPRGTWQQPREFQKPRDVWQQPKDIQQPTGPWQQPGAIQQPTERRLQVEEVQRPAETQPEPARSIISVVRVTGCERRLTVVADALFDFDRSNLRPEAEEALAAAGPQIAQLGKPTSIEGHTDALGSHDYNLRLSEARAMRVRDWLAARGSIPAATPIKGFGKTKPVAPNQTSDGRDDPEGRQKNRRVEVVRHLHVRVMRPQPVPSSAHAREGGHPGPHTRHCEERSDEAIQQYPQVWIASLRSQ